MSSKMSKKTGNASQDAGTAAWRVHHLIAPVVLAAAIGIAYANSFSGTFIFDDYRQIVENERVHAVFPLMETLAGRRPILDLTLALNYAAGGLNVGGYHAVNLVIHMLAALLLFGVVRRTLVCVMPRATFGDIAMPLALVIALIWAVHPLQTQSVTYIIQRGESLTGLFYLLTLYGVIRGTAAKTRAWAWYVLAIAACALGMGTKAVMVTAPVVVCLYDAMFLAGRFRALLRRRWWLYAALGGTWIVLLACGVLLGVLGSGQRVGASVGFATEGVTPFAYALTQCKVITHYLHLALWPSGLCLDYGWQVIRSLQEATPYAALMLVLLAATVWAVARKHAAGFLGVWFFVVLSPTSSIVPINDVIFEHRMYLPLAAIVTAMVIAIFFVARFLTRRLPARAGWCRAGAIASIVFVIAALGWTTIQRNRTYHDESSMWRDVIAKQPLNPRAYSMLGVTLHESGRYDEAADLFRKAVEILPVYGEASFNLGMSLSRLGRHAEAEAALRRALQLNFDPVLVRLNLAGVLREQGKLDEAIAECVAAVAIAPDDFRVRYSLGELLAAKGDFVAAAESLRASLAINPSDPPGWYLLGRILARGGDLAGATKAFRQVLVLDPGNDAARRALQRLGQLNTP